MNPNSYAVQFAAVIKLRIITLFFDGAEKPAKGKSEARRIDTHTF